MFEHSIKVPRHYKIAANIFKKVSTEGGSVKTLLYDDKLRHFRTNVLFALITETIKHAADIDNVFEHCKLLEKEQRFDPWLAKVLTAELLFGKKSLPGKSKPEQTILSYKEQFEMYASEHQDDLKTTESPRPRYVRVNTNLLTTSDAIRAFQDEEYKFIRCTSGSYGDYLEQIQKLAEDEFTQDYHVKTIFVFPPGTKWHGHELYRDNHIILQDKATALAVHLLAPPPASFVLDMCAAPGMKTTQLAAYLRNDGKIYAVERNPERYKTLCEFVEKTGSKCVQTFNRDSLDIKKGEFTDVEYILLDPSCSGSGMPMSVHNYGPEQNRLEKLTSLQEKFLKHAMNSFPKARRIVYSTCSLYPEENERVIANVVKMSRAKWRVQNVKDMLKGQWTNFGSAMYGSTGTRCLYARPESDFTTGFFLAVLDRDEKDLAKVYRQEEKETRDKKKAEKAKKSNVNDCGEADENPYAQHIDRIVQRLTSDINERDKQKRAHDETNENETPEMDTEATNAKKKKNEHNQETVTPTNAGVEESEKPQKRKKIDEDAVLDQNSQSSLNSIIGNLERLNVEEVSEAPKKKKKKKDKINSNETENNDNGVVRTEDALPKEKKKKKKNHAYKTEKTNNNVVPTEDALPKENKKKKKNNAIKTKINDNDLVPTEVALPKEHSKKNKSKSNEVSCSVDQHCNIALHTENDKEKKRKKKKDKSGKTENLGNDAVRVEDEPKDNAKTKKNKSERRDSETVEASANIYDKVKKRKRKSLVHK